MHATVLVAIPGYVPSAEVSSKLDAIMERYSEHRDVNLHRDTSPYAEPRDVQLARAAKALGKERAKDGKDHTAGMTDDEILMNWSGAEAFDTDGWPLTTANPNGKWDWWVVGGRWGGSMVLKDGAEGGPLHTEESSFGLTDRASQKRRTDSARWGDIVPESVMPPYAWVGLDGEWHDRRIVPSAEDATRKIPRDFDKWEVPEGEHAADFMRFLASLPDDTWLTLIDYHH